MHLHHKITEYTSQDMEHIQQDIAHNIHNRTSQDIEFISQDFRIKQRFTRHIPGILLYVH